MKSVSKSLIVISKVILSLISVLLILLIITSILLLVSKKFLKSEYPSFLDYTYFITTEGDSNINLSKGTFLLIDTRKNIETDNVVMFKSNQEYQIGKTTTNENTIFIKNNKVTKEIDKEEIIGIVIYEIPLLGRILNKAFQPIGLIISIILLIVTTIIQSLINKNTNKNNNSKPNFNQTW